MAQVMIANKHGLHARPVTQFVQLANKFAAKVQVSNGDLSVDGKSVMSMLRLAAARGTMLQIKADGQDAADAVAKLVGLVESKFGEE
jgi:phosphocarrier protein